VDGYVQNSMNLSVNGVFLFLGTMVRMGGEFTASGLFAKIVSVAIPFGGIELLFLTKYCCWKNALCDKSRRHDRSNMD
jgi:hypothetical protein